MPKWQIFIHPGKCHVITPPPNTATTFENFGKVCSLVYLICLFESDKNLELLYLTCISYLYLAQVPCFLIMYTFTNYLHLKFPFIRQEKKNTTTRGIGNWIMNHQKQSFQENQESV